jgi:hypothetical protein
MTTTTISIQPWQTIWVRPRATIRSIVETDPGDRMMLLAMLIGIANTLETASLQDWRGEIMLTLPLCIILGIVTGPLTLHFRGMVFALIGWGLGGCATVTEVKVALAWAAIPRIVGLAAWIPLTFLLGNELFAHETPHFDAFLEANLFWTFSAGIIFIGLGGFSILMELWSVVLVVKCLSEVNGFSIWRALVTFVPLTIAATLGVWARYGWPF